MYKKQLKAQKILCLVAIIVAVVLFLYALGLTTDLYDTLYQALRIRAEEDLTTAEGYKWSVSERSVPGAMVYYDIQAFDQVLVRYSIILIVLAALLFVTNSSTRRRYYATNYIAVALYSVFSINVVCYAIPYISYFKQQWLNVDFAALKEFSEMYNSAYTESTLWFDLSWVVFALMIIATVLLVACTVWKVLLMRDEKKLLEEGKGKKVKA